MLLLRVTVGDVKDWAVGRIPVAGIRTEKVLATTDLVVRRIQNEPQRLACFVRIRNHLAHVQGHRWATGVIWTTS